MLYIVLFLVFAALGLLTAAMVTDNSLWAYISIGISLFGGAVLLADWFRRRGRPDTADDDPGLVDDGRDDPGPDDSDLDDDEFDDGADPVRGAAAAGASREAPRGPVGSPPARSDRTEVLPISGDLGGPGTGATERVPRGPELDADPAEEKTDAADLLIVSELPAQVHVVDEYPRYHLGGCEWLDRRETIPIAVSEARELGFTPCARCAPDSELAIQYRAKRRSPTKR